MMQLAALVGDTFRESRDRKLFWVLLAISTIVAIVLGCIGFDDKGWSLLFGMYHVSDPVIRAGSPAVARFYGFVVSNFLVAVYIGWLGVGLSLVATAGVFPSMMQTGAIDLLLSKPMSRWKLFFGKYLGSLVFVLVQSSYFVVLTLIVIGLRAGVWIWTYLWCIPLLLLMFSYLYSVCVLIALWSRSAMTSLLLTIAFWFICFVIQSFHTLLRTDPQFDQLSKVRTYVTALHTVIPKTSDTAIIASKVTGAGSFLDFLKTSRLEEQLPMNEDERREVSDRAAKEAEISIAWSIATSLGFEAVVLGVAGWRFRRKDF